MSIFESPSFDNHEGVHVLTDAASGLRAVVAVHSTARGPAAGGTRLWTYRDGAAAIEDVLRLSRAMSYKNAMADLPLGGGKAVVLRPAGDDWDRAALFAAYGRAIDGLGGRYFTAEDVGVTPQDMAVVATQTRYVAGLTTGAAASGDPSPVTARGVFKGIRAGVKRALGQDDLKGVRIAVQGVGHVGGSLCDLLAEDGAELVVCDVNAKAVAAVCARTGARSVAAEEIYDQPMDVFAPCALGGAINPDTLDRLSCKVVAGAANNQLATPEMGEALRVRGVLFAPDYVVNAGGIINVAAEISGRYEPSWVEAKLQGLVTTLNQIFDVAEQEDRATNVIADDLARARLVPPSDAPQTRPTTSRA